MVEALSALHGQTLKNPSGRWFKMSILHQWTVPLKEAASLLWYFYRDPLRSLTLLSLNVLSQKS